MSGGRLGRAWDRMYDLAGGNPWAAMPSLHFATSLMAALLLAEIGPIPGALGVGYAAALAFALVYLGALRHRPARRRRARRRGPPRRAGRRPAVAAVNGILQRLERIAAA